MTDGIELVVRELINKVEASQSMIDDLRSKLESQKEILAQSDKLQAELEYYYLLSQKQRELISANEDLHKKVIKILANMER
jgi:hypothetical protein